MCEKLAESFYAVVPGRDSNPLPLDRESDILPQHHDATLNSVTILILRYFTEVDSFCDRLRQSVQR